MLTIAVGMDCVVTVVVVVQPASRDTTINEIDMVTRKVAGTEDGLLPASMNDSNIIRI